MKKRIFSILMIAALCLSLLAGCGTAGGGDDGKLHIICTIFPQYDWTREVLGERIDDVKLTLLMDNGADLHNYQSTTDDMIQIAACDLFLYNGGTSDSWAADALKNPTNPDRQVVGFMEALHLLEEEQCELDHDHEKHDHAVDEHFWLSLRLAMQGVDLIAEKLAMIDPDHAEVYRTNSAAYQEKLMNLDKGILEDLSTAKRNTLLFADRFPFEYMTKDYGIETFAAFSGCSAETEASFETIAMLSGKVEEKQLPAVMVIESGDQTIAKTVIANTKTKDQKILVLDSLQSVTKKRMEAGETYYSIMEKNRSVLYEALH